MGNDNICRYDPFDHVVISDHRQMLAMFRNIRAISCLNEDVIMDGDTIYRFNKTIELLFMGADCGENSQNIVPRLIAFG